MCKRLLALSLTLVIASTVLLAQSPSMLRGAQACPPGNICPDASDSTMQFPTVPLPKASGPVVLAPEFSPDYPAAGQPASAAGTVSNGKPQEPTEFQQFVAASYGRRLPLFGYGLFADVPSTFAPLDRVPVTSDYVIGPGDEVLTRVWGQVDLDARVVVDRAGNIYLPKVGTVKVAGLKFSNLEPYLKGAVGRVFRNFDLNVNLGQLRSIQVFVVGQARRPGTYTVGSLSTLVNALFACGGPSVKGSMPHIQLKRDNRVVTEIDIYDLLLRGDKSRDTALLPGDVIFIPPVGPQTAIAGSVNTPAIYELKDGTDLDELVRMAGGLTSVADNQHITVERIHDHEVRRIEEFPLDPAAGKRAVQDGDFVRVLSLSPRFDNAVTLRGNVAIPGRYAWHAGMHVCDLIPSREALVPRDYWEQQNAASEAWNGPNSAREYRGPNNNADGQQNGQANGGQANGGHQNGGDKNGGDKIHRSTLRSSVAALHGVASDDNSSSDPPPEPAEAAYWQTQNATAAGHKLAPVPEINWDYALIQRMDSESLSTHLLPFNLGHAIENQGSQDNLELKSGDIVTIFSQADLRVPVREQNTYVYLEGEFKAAGVYRAFPGETLKQLVQRVGGLGPHAYLYGAEFTRESTRREQQKGLRELLHQAEQEMDRQSTLMLARATSPEENATLRLRLDSQRTELEEMKRVPPTGRIVLELQPDDTSAESLPDLVLEDGDRFFVPHRLSSVNVLGQVYNNGTFLYNSGKTVRDYLRLAGGGTRYADAGRMFVLRADGSVLGNTSRHELWSKSLTSIRLMPGDTVVVPNRIIGDSVIRQLKDWTQIFSQFALGAAAVRIIKNP